MQKPNFPQDASATIRRDNATLATDPDPIRVKAGGTIEWTCDEGDFCITIYREHGDGCLEQGRVLHGRKGHTVRARVKPKSNGSGEATYHYVVAAYVAGKVYAEDPDIIVGPDTP